MNYCSFFVLRQKHTFHHATQIRFLLRFFSFFSFFYVRLRLDWMRNAMLGMCQCFTFGGMTLELCIVPGLSGSDLISLRAHDFDPGIIRHPVANQYWRWFESCGLCGRIDWTAWSFWGYQGFVCIWITESRGFGSTWVGLLSQPVLPGLRIPQREWIYHKIPLNRLHQRIALVWFKRSFPPNQ